MRTAYIANVGTRDLQLDGKPLQMPRPDGAALSAEYAAVRARLSAPILLPGLRHVLDAAQRIEHVQLFASDQPPPPATREEFYGRDTIELGRILERLLRDELGSQIGTIDCRPIPHNPADYDRALAFFAAQLQVRLPPDQYDAVWIAPIGGADASNVGLMLNATRTYRSKCQFIYVPPGTPVQTLSLHREILGDYAREEAKAYLRKRDFVALRDTLSRSGLGGRWQLGLCTYADCRLRFDFAGAKAALDEASATANSAEARARVEQCRVSLAPLLNENGPAQPDSTSTEQHWNDWLRLQRTRLTELYFNLRLKVLREEWVDFLGRLFRLSEASLRLAFEQATRHSTEISGKVFPDFVKAVEADPELVARFKQDDVSWEKPETQQLRLYLGVQARRDGAKYGPVHAAMKKIGELAPLRNKSILGHGFEGVSRERIEDVLKRQSVHDFVERDLRALLEKLGASVTDGDDPLLAVVRWLEEV